MWFSLLDIHKNLSSSVSYKSCFQLWVSFFVSLSSAQNLSRQTFPRVLPDSLSSLLQFFKYSPIMVCLDIASTESRARYWELFNPFISLTDTHPQSTNVVTRSSPKGLMVLELDLVTFVEAFLVEWVQCWIWPWTINYCYSMSEMNTSSCPLRILRIWASQDWNVPISPDVAYQSRKRTVSIKSPCRPTSLSTWGIEEPQMQRLK